LKVDATTLPFSSSSHGISQRELKAISKNSWKTKANA